MQLSSSTPSAPAAQKDKHLTDAQEREYTQQFEEFMRLERQKINLETLIKYG